MTYLEISLAAITLIAAFFYVKLYRNIKKLKLELTKAVEVRNKLMFQKKQSEIVTGQVAEKLAPFLKDFKHDPQHIQFLGNPIDYIAFEEKGVTLIEIKSANSRLTKKQQTIKKQVKSKKVFWEEFRIK
jgi:predicted Holliday junction resolvase-like endonuclease